MAFYRLGKPRQPFGSGGAAPIQTKSASPMGGGHLGDTITTAGASVMMSLVKYIAFTQGGCPPLRYGPLTGYQPRNARGITRARIGWCQLKMAQKILTLLQSIGFQFFETLSWVATPPLTLLTPHLAFATTQMWWPISN